MGAASGDAQSFASRRPPPPPSLPRWGRSETLPASIVRVCSPASHSYSVGMKRWSFLLGLVMLVGCGPESRSYNVTVENRSPEPMTLWLTKNGSPLEKQWASPEDIAVLRLNKGETVPGTVLPSGERRGIGPVEGKFGGNASAVLRVYRGQQKFDQLLSTNKGSPNRQDVTLTPGDNTIIIGADGVARPQ